jgi:tetratricopeptide (TPR) repeat protein
VLALTGDHAAAAARFAEALGREPARVDARLAHATALLLAGRAAEARDSLLAGLRATPGEPNLTHALARLLASSPDPAVRDGQRALELARSVFEQEKTMEHAETVAMAYAESGAFDDAVRWQRTLLAEAERLGDAAWTARLRANLERYQRGEGP